MAKGKAKSGRISVFKGKEARLNRAIFHVLALKGPLAIYDIHKGVKAQRNLRSVRYPSVLKRVRSLEKSGCIRKKGVRKTASGEDTFVYELTQKAQLATLLDSISLEEFFTKVDEATASAILATIKKSGISALSKK